MILLDVLIIARRGSDPTARKRVSEEDLITVLLKTAPFDANHQRKNFAPVQRSKFPTALPVSYNLTTGAMLSARASITMVISVAFISYISNDPI